MYYYISNIARTSNQCLVYVEIYACYCTPMALYTIKRKRTELYDWQGQGLMMFMNSLPSKPHHTVILFDPIREQFYLTLQTLRTLIYC